MDAGRGKSSQRPVRELRSAPQQQKIGATLSSTTEFTEEQLAAARSKAWHQTADPLLTLDAARDWINASGLLLFAPRAGQLPSPAPSLVEATLGAANAAPTLAETEAARGLVSRLVGEGLALPLNLLGVPGDSPDFVVSAQVFSYIFTMRGDKAWKLPPATSGAVKVSPLGLRVYEVLTERGPMSAQELAQELGREVTEAAILRSLSELWSQLRVLPLLQTGEGTTLWELTTRRFTKAIKAGANAGQPKALSALVSLYLAQAIAATEEEIVTFLSPLTARSRLREVVHALLGARQLETVVLQGKTLLHLPGALPATATEEGSGEVDEIAAAAIPRPKKVGTGRITKFSDSPERKAPSEFRGKPARSFGAPKSSFGKAKPGFGAAKPSYSKPAGGTRPTTRFGKSDTERRPFKKDGAAPFAKPAYTKPTYTKPWDEERAPRPSVKDAFTKFRKPAPEDRAPLGKREQAGLPPEKRTAPQSSFKSSFDRAGKPGGFAKRPYTPRTPEGSSERPTFKPRSYERKEGAGKPAFGTKRPYTPRTTDGGEKSFSKPAFDRGAKPGLGAKRPYTPLVAEGGDRPFAAKRPYAPRTTDGGEKSFSKPAFDRGSKPSFGAKRPYSPRKAEGSFPKRSFTSRDSDAPAGSSVERSLPKRPHKPRAADADKRVFTKAPWVPTAEDRPKPKRSSKPRYGGKSGSRKRSE
jgi:hypothetical protein